MPQTFKFSFLDINGNELMSKTITNESHAFIVPVKAELQHVINEQITLDWKSIVIRIDKL